jgi:hypothetical protein
LGKLVAEESKKICDGNDMETFNRFVVVAFGDLKNYIYAHRYE